MKKLIRLLESIRIKTRYEKDNDIIDECLLTAGFIFIVIGCVGILSVILN